MRSFAVRHRVISLDLAGHGESGIGRSSWTIPAFGDDVVAVCEQLGLDDSVLIGHSMGGDVIVESALRLGRRVRGLVWVDTYASLGQIRTSAEIDAVIDPLRRDFSAGVRRLVRGMFPTSADPALVESVVADMSSAPPEIAIESLRHAIGNDRPILAAMPRLRAPVVAINPDLRATDDASLARYGVRATVMSNVGHFLMMEDPEQFDRTLAEVVAALT